MVTNMNNNNKRLVRNMTDNVLYGVCAGLGDYFNIDYFIIRFLTMLAFLFFPFEILIIYFIAVLILESD